MGHRLGPHVIGQRVVVRRRVPAGARPHRRAGADRRPRGVYGVGLPARGDPARGRLGGVGHHRRHRVRASRSRHGRRRGCGSPRVTPSCAPSPCGPSWRRLRWVPGRCAGPGCTGRGGPTRRWRWGPRRFATRSTGVISHYERLGRRPIAAVLPESDEEEQFRRRGWIPESSDADSLFQVAGVAAARRRLQERPAFAVTVTEDGNRVEARVGGAAAGFAALTGDWLGLRSVEVAAERRRHGLGLAVVAALLDWARRARRRDGVPPGPRGQRPRPGPLRPAGVHHPPLLPVSRSLTRRHVTSVHSPGGEREDVSVVSGSSGPCRSPCRTGGSGCASSRCAPARSGRACGSSARCRCRSPRSPCWDSSPGCSGCASPAP